MMQSNKARIEEIKTQVTNPMFCGNVDLYKELFDYMGQLEDEIARLDKILNVSSQQYNAWRVTFQDANQAALSAFNIAIEWHSKFNEIDRDNVNLRENIAELKHEIERLKTPSDGEIYARHLNELSQWHVLKSADVLHANLLRGQPAQLSREQFLHLAGNDVMTEERAREILGSVDTHGNFLGLTDIGGIILNGQFHTSMHSGADKYTLDQLKALVWFMENKK